MAAHDETAPAATKSRVRCCCPIQLGVALPHGDQRHAETLDEGMLSHDQLDKQLAAGKRSAIVESEIALYRKLGNDPEYDPRSVRMTI
jgi:hypothetical protein